MLVIRILFYVIVSTTGVYNIGREIIKRTSGCRSLVPGAHFLKNIREDSMLICRQVCSLSHI